MNDVLSMAQGWLAQANAALEMLPQAMTRADWWLAIVLVPVGVMSLLYGYRVFKGVVVVYSATVAAGLGWYVVSEVVERPEYGWAGALAGGLLAALLAWPMLSFVIGLWGAVAGGLAAYAIARATGDTRILVIGVGLGMVVGALLGTLVFRLMVVVMTSVVGAYAAVIGIVSLLARVERLSGPLSESLASSRLLLPAIVAAPAAVGIVYQLYRSEDREAKDESGSDKKERQG